jgi:hypothetical protein
MMLILRDGSQGQIERERGDQEKGNLPILDVVL